MAARALFSRSSNTLPAALLVAAILALRFYPYVVLLILTPILWFVGLAFVGNNYIYYEHKLENWAEMILFIIALAPIIAGTFFVVNIIAVWLGWTPPFHLPFNPIGQNRSLPSPVPPLRMN